MFELFKRKKGLFPEELLKYTPPEMPPRPVALENGGYDTVMELLSQAQRYHTKDTATEAAMLRVVIAKVEAMIKERGIS